MTTIHEAERDCARCGEEGLHGLAPLMRMAFAGVDLTPLGSRLLARVERNPDDADALLDLSILLQLRGDPEVALGVQAQALALRRLYHIPAQRADGRLRLLVIKGPGEIMWNTPLEFLVAGSEVALDIVYVTPDLPWPENVPDHDVVFVAVSHSERNEPLLRALAKWLDAWPRPVLNRPLPIAALSRDAVSRRLGSCPGVHMPVAVRMQRDALEHLAARKIEIADALAHGSFPLVMRPVDSQAGEGLAKLDRVDALQAYLAANPDEEFFVSPFVDYRGGDGLFRKYRIAFIRGEPFICHMGVSTHWMIHYLNAGMTESAEKRAEEAKAMARFEQDFALRHRRAFAAIDERIGLDYFGVDCAEMPTGELLIFEVSNAMLVHDMDPVDLFPYK